MLSQLLQETQTSFFIVFRIETAVFYIVPILLVLILIPSIVYVEHFNFNVSTSVPHNEVVTPSLQNLNTKLFAISRYIHKNRNVAQIFSFLMSFFIYLLVILQSVSSSKRFRHRAAFSTNFSCPCHLKKLVLIPQQLPSRTVLCTSTTIKTVIPTC